ncbi:c-type cytochrome [Inquilinus limosus]|uniref:c-type cytochrome n=1 Tax=Inquilinus limosus TaxID=171674 RepID=UPI00047C123F|nr:c-type cytochrome [Inquilinus limosus]
MRRLPTILLLSVALLASGCRREERSYDTSRAESAAEVIVALAPISPGGSSPQTAANPKGQEYEHNAYAMSQGKRLFQWYNCSGCHGNGGGGSGPALIDDKWIYGSGIDNIVATIREGRPNGMPSFRGRIPDDQIWQIAAYVRSMGRFVPKDAAPSRNDGMQSRPAENRLPPAVPRPVGVPQ